MTVEKVDEDISALYKGIKKLVEAQLGFMPTVFLAVVKNYRYLLYTWGQLFEFHEIDEETEKKFNELYTEFDKSIDKLQGTIAKMQDADPNEWLIQYGQFTERYYAMGLVVQSLTKMIDAEFERLKKEYEDKKAGK